MFLKDVVITLCCVDRLQTNFMYQSWVNALEMIMCPMWSFFLQGPLYHFRSGSGMDIIVSYQKWTYIWRAFTDTVHKELNIINVKKCNTGCSATALHLIEVAYTVYKRICVTIYFMFEWIIESNTDVVKTVNLWYQNGRLSKDLINVYFWYVFPTVHLISRKGNFWFDW